MPATNIEQMLLEMINRARLDPAAEAASYGIDLNEGLAAGTISPDSKQPLAMNETLLSIARTHTQDMLTRQYFAHNTPEGVTPFQRMTNAGYNYSWAGENIAWSGTTGSVSTAMRLGLHELLFVDAGVSGRGHRLNILNSNFQEIGVGEGTGIYSGYNATMVTEDFGSTGSQQFLTGVSYTDSDHDNFYSIGEGRGSIAVSISGGTSTTTGSAGGYSAQIGSGVKTVTFSGGGLVTPMAVSVTITAGTNAKVDAVDQGVVCTSASLSAVSGVTNIIGLGTFGLALSGAGGSEGISGTKGGDTLSGNGGNDTLISNGGNDTFNGGAGWDRAILNFASTSATLSQNASTLAWTLSGSGQTEILANVEVVQFSNGVVRALRERPRSDFDGNNCSDILWRNASNGAVYENLMNGSQVLASTLISGSGTYSCVGTGDFNGDGRSDILWRSNSTGAVYENLMNGTQVLASTNIGGGASSCVGTGDFNGDGRSDILWRSNSTGAVYENLMNGSQVLSSTLISGSGTYSCVGTGDFNGDGRSDILWRNASNGAVYENLMNGSQVLASTVISGSGTYSCVATGDFNGDGRSDILWRSNSNGAVYENLMNGSQVLASTLISGSGTYSCVGTGDFNGDGRSDILWRNASNGAVYENLMNGSQVLSSTKIGGSTWSPILV